MLVLNVKYKETITIGNNMSIRVKCDFEQTIKLEVRGPSNTVVCTYDQEKEIGRLNLLTLPIKYCENVFIGDDINFRIYKLSSHAMYKLCIAAPKSILIFRAKVIEKMKRDGISWDSI